MQKRCFAVFLGLTVSTVFLACNKDKAQTDQAPIVGVLELPISHRSGGSEPSQAAKIELSPSEVRVDGETVLPLQNGKVAPEAVQGDVLPSLSGKLGGKSALSLSVHAAVPYATLAQVINTGLKAGAKQLAFRVRKPSATTETGWLVLNQVHFTPSAESGAFDEAQLLPWESFTASWDESLDACKVTTNGDCGYRPLAKAEGGKLDMMLRVRGSGVALRFRQTGIDEADKPEPKKVVRAELLDGIQGGPAEPQEEAPPEPSTEHVFTLRSGATTAVPSPISGITQPVCGSRTCPAVLDAEGISMSGLVLSAIGASFPDGTAEPKLAWVLPPKTK